MGDGWNGTGFAWVEDLQGDWDGMGICWFGGMDGRRGKGALLDGGGRDRYVGSRVWGLCFGQGKG